MQKWIFWSVIFITCGTGMMLLMASYPGYVLVSAGEYAIEFSLWFFITALFLGFFVVFFSIRVFKYFLGGMKGSILWFKTSRGRKIERRTQSGLMHFIEGNWQSAKKDLLSVAKNADKPLLHYLAAAKSAHKLGRKEETEFLLEQAEKTTPEDNSSIVISQAQMQFEDKKYEQCLATINRIKTRTPVVLSLLSNVYIKLGDWPALVDILPELKKHADISEEEFSVIEENAYLSLLSSSSNNQDENLNVTDVWQALPKHILKNSKITGLYATLLHQQSKDDIAEQLISKALKSQWHSGLVELYGKLRVSNVKTQLSTAESWAKHHKDDACLNYALGKICMRNSLWGKAKNYFEESLKIKERPEVYADLAGLMAQLGEKEKSNALYKKGLLLKIS